MNAQSVVPAAGTYQTAAVSHTHDGDSPLHRAYVSYACPILIRCWCAEPSPTTLTEIRGAARTTRSDPGRRKKQLAHRRDGNAAKATPNTQSSASGATAHSAAGAAGEPQPRGSGASQADSLASSSANASNERARGPTGSDEDYVTSESKPVAAAAQGNRPNSRSALDLPGQVWIQRSLDVQGIGECTKWRTWVFAYYMESVQHASSRSGT